MKKLNLMGIAVVLATTVLGTVTAQAAQMSALTSKGNAYFESTERKVGDYLQSNDVVADEEVSVVTEEIPFETLYVESDTLYEGEEVTTQEGVNGVKEITTTNKVVDGNVVTVVISEKEVSAPVNAIVKVGTKEKTVAPANGYVPTSLSYSQVMTLDATAYCPCSKCCGKWANGVTATGLRAGYGVAAVDPRVIPLGTKLYVEGYGYCIAGDTGGAIKGNRIDLCYGSHSEALASGYGHKATKVYILN